MPKRMKQPQESIASMEGLEQAMGSYAALIIKRDKMLAELDAQINQLRERYEQPVRRLDEDAQTMLDDIEAFALLSPGIFPDGKKSVDLLSGTIGWRTTPPAVKQIRGVKAEHTVHALQTSGREDLLRVSTALAKDVILAEYTCGRLSAEHLKSVGLKIEQSESFYAEVKREEVSS